MKKGFLPTGVLFMLLVVALAAIGVGYALWSKVLYIEGTVETGSVDAVFTDAFTDDDDYVDNPDKDSQDVDGCEDLAGMDDYSEPINQLKDGPDNGMTSCDPAASGVDPKLHFDKDVARCDAMVDPDDDQVAIVKKSNVYPGYFCTAWFDVENTGTIPVKIVSATVNGEPVIPSEPTPFDLDGDGLDDVKIHLTGIDICQQIEPGPENAVQMDIDQEILQDAPEGSTLSYEVAVQLNQWNEAPGCP